ncbi:MAG TPA: NAD(P)-binding domain-containing protein [Steroidobacteraceae bacterium]|nr:NAD(P)-binding domain-containing protein [Steroidobacteraceae bacterium]
MTVGAVDIVIIGAGPYGLSLAAHLRQTGQSFRIFGEPMRFWSQHMPCGMRLKSEGFASNLWDPDSEFTLETYCEENGVAYADIGLPVAIETFIAYGCEFQRRYVPQLEQVEVRTLVQRSPGFELTTAAGEIVHARHVVVATGIGNFAHLPPELVDLPRSILSHSSEHSDLTAFKGRQVAVLGAGASALDFAALLTQGGTAVQLIARGDVIRFHEAPREPRPLVERIKAPRSGLGTGWRSRLCCDTPMVFHALPQSLRLRAVARHLGPAPCWFVRDAVVGHVTMHLSATLEGAVAAGAGVRLAISQHGEKRSIEVDHVIAATGYSVAVSRLGFINESLQARIDKVDDTPILGRHFESSVPGLYFIGVAAANSFGPLLRFAFGAGFAAKRVARHVATA